MAAAMSAYFLLVNRDLSPVQPALAEKIFRTLDHFGVDQKHMVVRDNFALGYQSFWTVPEEQGEQQPLYDTELGNWLVFCGRIDNREELLAELQCGAGEPVSRSLSDARLLMAYLARFGDTRLANIVGPFVFAYFSPASNTVLAARDAMGGRYQALHISSQHILISSFDLALAAHPAVGYELNPEKRIRQLCNIMEARPSSSLRGVTPMRPGQKLQVLADVAELETFYLPDPKKRIVLADSQHYADEFRRLLDQAVSRRLRSIGKVGSMLSGGMDSVPITISARQALSADPDCLTAFSWVFDKYPEADEREYSVELCQRLGISQQLINCDEIWPKFDAGTYTNPTLPYLSPYSEFNQALFAKAQGMGITTLLSGIGGDMLYTGSRQILVEMFRQGRWQDLWREARSLYKKVDNGWLFYKRYVLSGLPLLRGWLAARQAKSENTVDYLTEQAQSMLKLRPHWLRRRAGVALRPQQYRNVVDAFEGEDANYGKHMESKFHLQRRYPLRDRDLVEFMLAIPSDQLYSMGVQRPVVKRAYRKEMDEALIQRNSKTDFSSVIEAGIESDEAFLYWLERAGENYHADVKNCNFSGTNSGKLGVPAIIWRIAYHEYWKSVCYNPTASELG